MKILAVTQFFTPDITAAAYRIAETVEDLRETGYEVEVITTFPHKSEVSNNIETGSNGVHRVSLPDTENKGFLGYIYLYVTFMIKSIAKGLRVGRKQKPDIIWASSPPIFVGLAGWVVAKILGAGFALDIRDVWPDSAVAAGQITKDGVAYRIGRCIEKFLYTHADVITCVANPMKNYIQEQTTTEVKVIYNGVEISGLENTNTNENKVLDNFVTDRDSKKILYAGNFGHVQQLDLLVDVFAEIKDEKLDNKWEIFFLGGGVQKENLVKLISHYNLSGSVHFLDPVPKTEIFNYLKSADVLFIHLMDSEVLRLTIPSKVFDYMLANRPLLAGIRGEGKKIIDSVSGNYTFKPGSKDCLKHSFLRLDQNISEANHPDNANTVKEYYTREDQSRKLDIIFKRRFTN